MWLSPTILHIYGPIAIHTYGFMITVGIATFICLSFNDPLRKKYISEEIFHNTILIGIIAGIFGCRLLFALTNFNSKEGLLKLFLPWEPGGSLLGAVIMIPLISGLYLWNKKAPALIFLDIAAVYAPLLQAISRIGCFGAGCCYGLTVAEPKWWTVVYTHPEALAPLNIPFHPTQLYSAALSFAIFLTLYFFSYKTYKQHGLTLGLYFMLEGAARFCVDFFRSRSDHEIEHSFLFYGVQITYYQSIALGIIMFGIFLIATTKYYAQRAGE